MTTTTTAATITTTAALKVYYTLGDINCLARAGIVQATPVTHVAGVATVDLRACAAAVTAASPELLGDKAVDYSIYTLDATEGIEGNLFEGQGLLSWGLAQPSDTRLVSGLLKPAAQGQFLEVRMKLSQVAPNAHGDFLHALQAYERIAKTLPPTFDHSNWLEFMRHANNMLGAKNKPIRKSMPSVNTLHKARELAARQTPQGMSAQLLAARQQQTTSQMHAHRIAQQAAAQQQPRSTSQDGEGPIPDPVSPQLPTPSSPPQLRTFVHPVRSNSMPIQDQQTGLPPLAKFNTTGAPELERGVKRKAEDMLEKFSPSKMTNAARSKFGAVQQLFKSTDIARPTVMDKLQELKGTNQTAQKPLPAQRAKSDASMQKNDRELLDALKEGKPIKFCYNCGTIQTKGNWRVLVVENIKQNLCNACGVYYKNKKTMRPQSLWKPMTTLKSLQKMSQAHTPVSDDDPKQVKTSPISANDFKHRARAVQSSPVQAASKRLNRALPTALPFSSRTIDKDRPPSTPDKKTNDVLHEIHLNTPPQPPSPSPASGGVLEDLVALLQTPKKSFSSKILSSPSPWRSMFTTLPESPAKQKFDKFLEELAMGEHAFDINAFQLSPNTQDMANFMSSPPSLGLFTSSAGEENLTPDDDDKTIQPKTAEDVLVEGDSLFTPRKPTTRSDTTSVQRICRSAGGRYDENMFGQ